MRRKKEHIDSFIGKDAKFEGKLSFKGTVRIDGTFIGKLNAGGDLIIGVGGRVDAEIKAASIICWGEINGRVVADKIIDIRTPGKMFGDIQAPTVVIQEGVIFEGNCRTHTKKNTGNDASGKVRQINTNILKSTVNKTDDPAGTSADTNNKTTPDNPKKSINIL